MNNKEKTKELFREKIFAIHEAYETENWVNLSNIEHSIRWNLMKISYKGHKRYLKDFTIEYAGHTYKIEYTWEFEYIKKYRRKKQTNTTNWRPISRWVEDKDKDPIKSKVSIISQISIKRIR